MGYYIRRTKDLDEDLKKLELDEADEDDFGEWIDENKIEIVDKSGMFEDFNFKLIVLNSLLDNEPSFGTELEKLKEKYDEYLFELDGAVLEPFLTFFENIVLTKEDLEKVTEICFDDGNEIYEIIYPGWDGEDEFFEVHSVNGFEKLKNLKKVVYIANSADIEFDENLLDKFRENGIEVE